jgi:hypothetical protein
MLTAAHKKLGADVELEAHYNEEAGEIEVFQFKTVMEKVLDPDLHISVAEARRTLDEEAEPGDSLGIKIETSTFGRIAVQTAKQIIIQRVKDAERDNIYDEYHVKKGELANGFVQRFEGGNIIVNLGRAEGIIPISEQIFKESYKRGERIRAFICEVKKITKGPQIILDDNLPVYSAILAHLFDQALQFGKHSINLRYHLIDAERNAGPHHLPLQIVPYYISYSRLAFSTASRGIRYDFSPSPTTSTFLPSSST